MTLPGLAETSAFVAVLEEKSFSRAARQLDLSPPRVSELVRQLEMRLGVRLVERTTRSVAPTAAGERLLAQLKPALDDYRTALEAVDDFRDKPAGQLRLTVAPPAIDSDMVAVLARFLAAYPQISLEVSAESGLVDIVAGRFDAGIRAAERLERDMIAVRVSESVPMVAVAAPGYIAQRGRPRTPRDLAAHDGIRIRFGSGATASWRFRLGRRTVEVPVSGRLVVNDAPMAIDAAIAGAGLLQMPRTMVARGLADGGLLTVLDEFQPPALDGFFLYYPSRRQLRPPLKALVEFLRQARRERRR
ncbi:LysR substrate-binding domain-containing protein [Reyranella sp.]|uniref:LysR substrate-binding domain-containing protein n=1 Tax=Reyranella sp. TaxID=1929291 RepID=UPI003BAB8933